MIEGYDITLLYVVNIVIDIAGHATNTTDLLQVHTNTIANHVGYGGRDMCMISD